MYRALFIVSDGWDRVIRPPLQWSILPFMLLVCKQGDTH
jgi:hypothetical protein